MSTFFFFNDTATTEIYTLSLHDALPISMEKKSTSGAKRSASRASAGTSTMTPTSSPTSPRSSSSIARAARNSSSAVTMRSEEHTSELQSRQYLVCRLLLEKKKQHYDIYS